MFDRKFQLPIAGQNTGKKRTREETNQNQKPNKNGNFAQITCRRGCLAEINASAFFFLAFFHASPVDSKRHQECGKERDRKEKSMKGNLILIEKRDMDLR